MKTTHVVTRHGKFKILLAVKGPRSAPPRALKHALAMAVNRIARSERRQSALRVRRATVKRREHR
jgi:hypothetical protein